jgi:hypothetical protein
VYVAHIVCPPLIEQKINALHGVSLGEVIDTFCWPARHFSVRRFVPTADDPRGERIVVRGRTSQGRTVQAVLYPVDEELGTWRLATAVPLV